MVKRIFMHVGLVAFALSFGAPIEAAVSRPPMGMFVLWKKTADGTDLGGREASLREHEQTLRLKPGSLLALDFYGNETWAEMISLKWVPGYWAEKNPARKLIWSVPLTMKGTPLRDIAAGAHDEEFKIAASSIAAAQPDAVIRIGWEMNGDWFAWAAAGAEADYIAAYRRVAGIFREASARFTFDWCPNLGQQASPPDLAYPGDDVVDTIGLDVYDVPTAQDPAARWRDTMLEGAYGFRWLESFSAQHRKPMNIGEWGLGLKGAPDNPYFIEKMSEWLRAHAASVSFHVYFDVPPHNLDAPKFIRSRARFEALFGGPRR